MSVVSIDEYKKNKEIQQEKEAKDFLLFCRHEMDQFDYTELLEAFFINSTYESLDDDMKYLCDQLKEIYLK